MSDVINVAQKIESITQEIDRARKNLPLRAQEKSAHIGAYEKKIALVMMGLKNGKEYKLEDQSVRDPVNTIIEKIARGICWKEKMNMDLAESNYKVAMKNLDALESVLQGYQSINRHLERV